MDSDWRDMIYYPWLAPIVEVVGTVVVIMGIGTIVFGLEGILPGVVVAAGSVLIAIGSVWNMKVYDGEPLLSQLGTKGDSKDEIDSGSFTEMSDTPSSGETSDGLQVELFHPESGRTPGDTNINVSGFDIHPVVFLLSAVVIFFFYNHNSVSESSGEHLPIDI
jgi:hypothetical protein